MKFIHCADIHLDTPLQGLAEYPGAPVSEIRNATRRAFEKVVQAAISEKIDFLIIAGDLYDTGLKSFESALYFNKQMAHLQDAGIDVYVIYGNHDAASKLIKQLRPPRNVHIFRATEPQTFLNDELRVALHGQSFATPAVTEDLAAQYPSPAPGIFNVGVLHTNLAGISEHANYAPCSLETLKNKGYQYWALGHVHNRQIVCTDPYIVYPGNIQGRNGREQGEKSCELVTVGEAGAVSVRTIPTSVVPWVEEAIDVSGSESLEDVYDKVRAALARLISDDKERVTALRVRVFGTTTAHAELSRDLDEVRNEVISIANECGSGLLWVERVQVATTPHVNFEALFSRDDPIGEVVRIAAALRQNPESVASCEAIVELQKKLPGELAEGAEPITVNLENLGTAMQEAESLLLARLSGSGAL